MMLVSSLWVGVVYSYTHTASRTFILYILFYPTMWCKCNFPIELDLNSKIWGYLCISMNIERTHQSGQVKVVNLLTHTRISTSFDRLWQMIILSCTAKQLFKGVLTSFIKLALDVPRKWCTGPGLYFSVPLSSIPWYVYFKNFKLDINIALLPKQSC